MGDTIPNCEFMHAHEEIIEKVNGAIDRAAEQKLWVVYMLHRRKRSAAWRVCFASDSWRK